MRFPYASWVSPMPSIHGPRIATIRWFARLAARHASGRPRPLGRIARGRSAAPPRLPHRYGRVLANRDKRIGASSSPVSGATSSQVEIARGVSRGTHADGDAGAGRAARTRPRQPRQVHSVLVALNLRTRPVPERRTGIGLTGSAASSVSSCPRRIILTFSPSPTCSSRVRGPSRAS